MSIIRNALRLWVAISGDNETGSYKGVVYIYIFIYSWLQTLYNVHLEIIHNLDCSICQNPGHYLSAFFNNIERYSWLCASLHGYYRISWKLVIHVTPETFSFWLQIKSAWSYDWLFCVANPRGLSARKKMYYKYFAWMNRTLFLGVFF